jgi:hypothetical protein
MAKLFTQVLLETQPREELWEWFITGMATILSLIFALGLFEYQSWRADKYKRAQILTALAGELRSNIGSMRSPHRTPLFGRVERQGGYAVVRIGEARLVRTPPVLAQAAISSGLFDAEETLILTKIVRELLVHDTEIDFLLSIRSGEHNLYTVWYASQELDERQERLTELFEEIIENLRQQGVEAPPATTVTREGDQIDSSDSNSD